LVDGRHHLLLEVQADNGWGGRDGRPDRAGNQGDRHG
jgi:hypothetical protein